VEVQTECNDFYLLHNFAAGVNGYGIRACSPADPFMCGSKKIKQSKTVTMVCKINF